ncbi:MAG: hemolysin family protein [Chloroflexi bacterium]|nr:hemolysin family protein [Chloroflexota bacterium]
MESGDLWMLALLAVCIILSAFFSSSETAFIALSRARLLHLVHTGHPRANLVSRLSRQPERLLATVLLSNNLVNTGAAALGTAIAIDLIDDSTIALLVSTFGVTALLLVFSETLPKSVAWKRAELVAFTFARPLALVQWILFPAIQVLHLMTVLFTRMVGISDPVSRNREQEIRTMIRAGVLTGEVEATEAELLEKVFHFGDQRMMAIMTPRPDIVWVQLGTTLSGFLSIYRENRHSRFPVYEGTTENIVGVLSVKDLLLGIAEGKFKSDDDVVTDHIRPVLFVPETKLVRDTFAEMQRDNQGLVLTVDEFGGIAGLASLEQLLEVIVGDVDEDRLVPEELYTEVSENVYRVDAGAGISEINGDLNLDLPEGQYRTVAGFILERLGRVPVEGDSVEFEGLTLTVQSMDGVRIEEVDIARRTNNGQPT